MHQYLDLLSLVRHTGTRRPSRGKLADGSQPDTLSLFGVQSRYNLADGFPLVTTKKLGTKGFVTELLWFLRGGDNVRFLHEHGCHIWDQWADEHGNLGPVYGKQWRYWLDGDGVLTDQITELECNLRDNPFSRRHILSAWNVGELSLMALPPCHVMSQFYVGTDLDGRGTLSCQMYQRSADLFLGAPWNIACYALLTCMLAQVTGLRPGEFIHTIGDAHIYENHLAQVDEQLKRAPRPLPRLWLDPSVTSSVDAFEHEHIRIEGYDPWGPLKGEVAV